MRSRLLALGFVAAMVAGVGLSSSSALAAVKPVPVKFAISPTRTEIPVGHYPVTRLIRVEDAGTVPITIHTGFAQGYQIPKGGFIFGRPGPQSGASWLKVIPSTFTLRAGQTRTVRLIVNVPAKHEPGQRFLGVMFTHSGAAPGQTGAVITATLGEEIILDVPGPVTHHVSEALKAPGFHLPGTVPLSLTIRNTGTVYALDNALSVSPGRSRFPGVLVLAHSTRTVQTNWTAPMFCLPCHVTVGKASASVWTLPLLQAGGLFLLAAVAVGLVMLGRRSGRKAQQKGGMPIA